MVWNAHPERALVVTLVLRLWAPHCCRAGRGMLGKGHWLAREVRNMLPEDWAQRQVPITMACACRSVSASCEAVGAGGRGGGQRNGKVRGTDWLEKSTCSPRARPPCRPRLSGRHCGCHHSNGSS